MYSVNPYDLPIPERHQLIISAVGPRPICWASTVNTEGEMNLAPYSFFNAYSSNPPILVFSSKSIRIAGLESSSYCPVFTFHKKAPKKTAAMVKLTIKRPMITSIF